MEPISLIIILFKNWWWVLFTLLSLRLFVFFYFWWIQWEMTIRKSNWILLEIKPPAENIKPISAMEDIFDILWSINAPPNWRERWFEGVLPKASEWFSWEIVSFGGEIKFFIRIKKDIKPMVESAIHAHYPTTEISEVPDYINKIPRNIPNADYELSGYDYTIIKEDYLPIKTYLDFEMEPIKTKEEELREIRLDPLNSLLEDLSKLKPTEIVLLQIVCAPVMEGEGAIKVVELGKKYIAKIRGEPEAKKSSNPLLNFFYNMIDELRDAFAYVITGVKSQPSAEKEKAEKLKPFLTPGEQKLTEKVERKISKKIFKTWIRYLYIYKTNQPQTPGAAGILTKYFQHFVSTDGNLIIFMGPTRTKIHYWMKKRRLFLRKRRLLRYYIERMPPGFPWNWEGRPFTLPFYPIGPGKICRSPLLSSEELATIFHFPVKIIIPGVPRVEARKGGRPPGVPIKE